MVVRHPKVLVVADRIVIEGMLSEKLVLMILPKYTSLIGERVVSDIAQSRVTNTASSLRQCM